MYVAAHLMQPTRKLDRADNPNVFLFGLAPDGVYQAFPVTWKTGALLPHRFTLTQPSSFLNNRAVYSLLHFPSRHRDSTLWSVLSCGVRTFLQIKIWRSFCVVRPIPLLHNGGFYCIEDIKSMNSHVVPQYTTGAGYS